MAKAKTGGTSAKLRGVVGDYIYQIIRNPQGYTEQRVIAYTKEKYNRKAKFQALARMQIAMFYHCMNLLTPIICNSFEGLRSRVNSCNRFVQINITNVQDYCAAHWKEAILCNWPVIGMLTLSYYPFIISEGSYVVPQQFSWIKSRFDPDHPTFRVDLSKTLCRKYDLRKIFGFANTDAFNALYWCVNGRPFVHVSIQFNPLFTDYQVITSENCGSLFRFTWNEWQPIENIKLSVLLRTEFDPVTKILSFTPLLRGTEGYSTSYMWPVLFSYIFSKKKGNLWLRNTNVFMAPRPQSESHIVGNAPYQAFDHYDPNYKGQDYDEYFK